MNKQTLVDRLLTANPGWRVWESLVDLVRSLDFAETRDEYLGDFLAAESRLSFAALQKDKRIPDFVPPYVSALFGMQADDPETAGGYAGCLHFSELAQRGALFSPAGNDGDMGYPVFDPPPETYLFQTNSSGGVIYINRDLKVVCPSVASQEFISLDALDTFTQKCLQKALDGDDWFTAYADIAGDLID